MDIHRCRFVDYTPHTITASAFSLPLTTGPFTPEIAGRLRLAIGRSNGDIEIWNPRHKWTHELTLAGSRGRSIEGLVWSTVPGESPRLFSIGGSTYITEWDLASGRPLTNYDCNAGVVWSIDVNSKGDKLAVGCDDGSVVIVDISGGPGYLEHEMVCQRQDLRVLTLKWHESSILVGGCADARVRAWSAEGENRGRIVSTVRVDKSKTESTLVWSVMVLSNINQFVTGDSTGSVKFWDLQTFSLLQTYKVHDADVLCLATNIAQDKVFTAGIDRKIHQFDLVTTKTKISKWVHSFNRLLHANDVRTMSVYQCKNYGFLVSAGVERSIVVQSVDDFEGKYRKISFSHSNVSVNGDLVVMWQDQTVKIWRIVPGEKYRLVAKMSLADDENITHVSLNSDASLLAVARITSVKVFRLTPVQEKLSVSKIRDEAFDNVIDGARKIFFYDNDKLLIVTPDDELYKFQVGEKIELLDEIENEIEYSKPADALQHLSAIRQISISGDSDVLAISRFNGSIDILPLKNESLLPYTLTKTSTRAMKFGPKNTLFVINEENKVYEYIVSKSNSEQKTSTLLSDWSKRNSEYLPQKYLDLEENPQDLFLDSAGRLWIFATTWLGYFDLSFDFVDKELTKKRGRDGLSIAAEGDDMEVDEEDDELEVSLRSNDLERRKEGGTKSAKSYWLTTKYRPILKVDNFGEDIVVIERPSFAMPTGPAFELSKIKV